MDVIAIEATERRHASWSFTEISQQSTTDWLWSIHKCSRNTNHFIAAAGSKHSSVQPTCSHGYCPKHGERPVCRLLSDGARALSLFYIAQFFCNVRMWQNGTVLKAASGIVYTSFESITKGLENFDTKGCVICLSYTSLFRYRNLDTILLKHPHYHNNSAVKQGMSHSFEKWRTEMNSSNNVGKNSLHSHEINKNIMGWIFRHSLV